MFRVSLIAVSIAAVPIVAVSIVMAAASGTAFADGFPCKKFIHNDDGSWRVIDPLTIEGPGGRKIDFTPDEVYTPGHAKLGLDMAKLLDANCVKK